MLQTTYLRLASSSARRNAAALAGRRRGRATRALLAVLLLALVCALPPSLAAATGLPGGSARQNAPPNDGAGGPRGDPTFLPDVSAGFEGLAKAGRWLPIRAVLANDGPPLSGELRLVVRASGADAVYTQPVELAARSRRLAVFQVPAPTSTGDLRLALIPRDDESPLAARDVPVRLLGPTDFLVGVVADDGTVPAGLGAVRRGGNPVAVARLTPADLPSDPLAYQALDALVIRQASSDRLTIEQRAALRAWLEQGGQLVVAGGPGWRRSIEGLDDLLPVYGLWTRQVKHLRAFSRYAGVSPPEGDVLVTLGSPIDGARVLLTQDSIPLVVERWLGLGRVTFVGPDPALEPFRSWPAAESLWQRILAGGRPGPPRLAAGASAPPGLASQVRTLLGDLLDLGLPAPGWIALFLAGYVVVVGPGQYLLLRRLDRREWAWGGFPLLAVTAAGLLLLGAAWLRGPEVRLAAVSTVRVAEGTRGALLDTVVGVVAPTRGSYDLALLDGQTPRPIGDRAGPAADPPVTIAPGTGGAPTGLPGLRLEGRALRAFELQAVVPAPAPLDAELRTTYGRLEGRVRNVGTERLEDAILVAAGEAIALGDLDPGASRPVSLALPTTRAPGVWQNGPPPWTVPTGRPGLDRRRALLSALFQGGRDSTGEAAGGALVLAWTTAQPPRLGLGADLVSGSAWRLVEQALPIDYGAEQVVIPPGLLSRTVLDGALLARGATTSFTARGPIVFQFDLPPALELARVDRLTVHLALAGASSVGSPPGVAGVPVVAARPGAGGAPPPRVSLYRWADRSWVDVPFAGSGVANVGFGASFVDGGAIRARIEPQGADVQVEQLDLSLDGVRE